MGVYALGDLRFSACRWCRNILNDEIAKVVKALAATTRDEYLRNVEALRAGVLKSIFPEVGGRDGSGGGVEGERPKS